MAKRKRSNTVLDSFELVDVTDMKGKRVKKAVCLLCNELQLTYTGGTTNLLNHLQSKHPTVRESSSSAKRQLTLRLFQSKQCSPDHTKDITRKIADSIVEDLHPIVTIEDSGFKKLIDMIEPGCKPPSYTHTTAICQCMYSSMREELRAAIDMRHIALTTDLWTSRATEVYLTVRVHFINVEWSWVNKVLLTHEMPERHRGQHNSARLLDAVTDWHMTDERVSGVVRDNAAVIFAI